MKKIFFGFAIADSMFPGNCSVTRQAISVDEAKEKIEAGVIPCLNPLHQATITAAEKSFGIVVEIPEKAPQVALEKEDSVIVMSVRGLPRLQENRHEYTEAEIASATFTFGLWTVVE